MGQSGTAQAALYLFQECTQSPLALTALQSSLLSTAHLPPYMDYKLNMGKPIQKNSPSAFSFLCFYQRNYQLPNNPGEKSTWGCSRENCATSNCSSQCSQHIPSAVWSLIQLQKLRHRDLKCRSIQREIWYKIQIPVSCLSHPKPKNMNVPWVWSQRRTKVMAHPATLKCKKNHHSY